MDKNYWDNNINYLKNTRNYFWNDDYFEFLVKQVWHLNDPVNVIDYGCGYGFLGMKLLPLLPKGSTYTGVDIGEELLKTAKQIFSSCDYETRFMKADLVDFAVTEKYDVAICQAVLRHIPEYEKVLSNMVDSVVKHGKVICIEVNRRMENAGLYVSDIDMDYDHKDDIVRNQWLSEIQEGGRDYLAGIKIPILMEKLGLQNVGVRVNDFVEFVSPNRDKEKYIDHLELFLKEHGLIVEHYKDLKLSALNARSLLISYGEKRE